jgi:hypothetical protein
MSREELTSPDVVPPVCRFFRRIIADPYLTEHDLGIVAQHTKDCKGCEDEIGRMIHEKIKGNKQADTASGT